jgi:hypothetical protein
MFVFSNRECLQSLAEKSDSRRLTSVLPDQDQVAPLVFPPFVRWDFGEYLLRYNDFGLFSDRKRQ